MGSVNHQTPVHDHSNKQFGGKLPASSIHDLAAAVAALVFPHTHTASEITDFVASVVALLTDANIPNNITLDNITQIVTRSHTNLQDIGVNDHATIDAALAVLAAHIAAASPHSGHAITAGTLAQFAATTSAQLRAVLSDETGNGAAVFQNGDLGTPSAAILTNCTGLPTAGLVNDAVTFAKMQNIATDRLIGRDTAGTGDPEVLTVGGGLEFTGSGGIQTAAKLRTERCKIQNAAPIVEVLLLDMVPSAATITRVGYKTESGSLTFNIKKRGETTPDSGGTNLFASNQTANTTFASKTSGDFSSAGITARDWLVLDIASVSSAVGLWLYVEYTID